MPLLWPSVRRKSSGTEILLEFGLDVRMSKYTGGDLDSVHPWIMGGYRF